MVLGSGGRRTPEWGGFENGGVLLQGRQVSGRLVQRLEKEILSPGSECPEQARGWASLALGGGLEGDGPSTEAASQCKGECLIQTLLFSWGHTGQLASQGEDGDVS